MSKSPVIFIIFKRPPETALVFEQIREARPPRLFVVADGPRNEEEKKLTEAAREITEKIDWPCSVERNYSEKNMGCRARVASGISWAMSRLENDTDGAIILEDDCLPEQSFFGFADEMLVRYAGNPQVLHIGGSNFQEQAMEDSYYFSRIAQIWGWATWKRAWKLYDGSMASWPVMRVDKSFQQVFPNLITRDYWRYIFDRMAHNELDTWDVAWTYTCFKEHGLAAMPHVNLIKNIGTSAGATHKASAFSNLPTSPLLFPLIHPKDFKVNEKADLFTYKKVYGIKPTIRNVFVAFVKEKLPFVFKNVKSFVK